jgi:hypothetical protein
MRNDSMRGVARGDIENHAATVWIGRHDFSATRMIIGPLAPANLIQTGRLDFDGDEFGMMDPAALRMVDDVDAPDTGEMRQEIVPVVLSQGASARGLVAENTIRIINI